MNMSVPTAKGHTHTHCKRMEPSFLDSDDKNIFAKHAQLLRNWRESKFGFHNFQETENWDRSQSRTQK